MIGVIDYGSGNKHAILDLLKRLSIPASLITVPSQLKNCEKFILPGVGAFDDTMRKLNDSGLRDGLNHAVINERKAILGICVGMQIMTRGSEEGQEPGLAWFDAFTKRLDVTTLTSKPKLPHLGWNQIEAEPSARLFSDIDDSKGFYFLHSYYVECSDSADIAARTSYGRPFASSIQKKNIFGCQFHPEKSHHNGLTVFRNFANLS
jgi:glutamine amidotransferase